MYREALKQKSPLGGLRGLNNRTQIIFLYSIKNLQDKLPSTLPTNYSTKHYKDDNTTGAIDYDNPVAINIERNKNYWVNQERCTTCPQSRTQEPPTDSHNLSQIDDASKRLKRSYAQASVEKFRKYGTNRAYDPAPRLPEQAAPFPRPTHYIKININTTKKEINLHQQNRTLQTRYFTMAY